MVLGATALVRRRAPVSSRGCADDAGPVFRLAGGRSAAGVVGRTGCGVAGGGLVAGAARGWDGDQCRDRVVGALGVSAVIGVLSGRRGTTIRCTPRATSSGDLPRLCRSTERSPGLCLTRRVTSRTSRQRSGGRGTARHRAPPGERTGRGTRWRRCRRVLVPGPGRHAGRARRRWSVTSSYAASAMRMNVLAGKLEVRGWPAMCQKVASACRPVPGQGARSQGPSDAGGRTLPRPSGIAEGGPCAPQRLLRSSPTRSAASRAAPISAASFDTLPSSPVSWTASTGGVDGGEPLPVDGLALLVEAERADPHRPGRRRRVGQSAKTAGCRVVPVPVSCSRSASRSRQMARSQPWRTGRTAAPPFLAVS